MYTVDDLDRVKEITDFPQSSVGAPLPTVVATEHQTFLIFYLQERPSDWDGTSVRVVDMDSDDEPLAIVSLRRCYAHMFGPPNDEAFRGHPLFGRGLHPYGAFKIEDSSWLRALERINAVHPSHSPELFKSYSHFVFAFHDSTFECIAEDYEIEITRSSIAHALTDVCARID